MIGRGMKNVVVSKIHCNMSDPFRSRVVVTLGIGEKHKIAALDVCTRNIFSLFDLSAGRNIQKDSRALVIYVLRQRRAIIFGRVEVFQEVAFAVMQPRCAVHIGVSEERKSVLDDLFDFIERMHLPLERLFLMPCAADRAALDAAAPAVADLCIRQRVRYGHRLQVALWSDTKGV